MKNLDKKLLKWQKILRLQDWNIILEKLNDKNKAGDFSFDRDSKSAVMKINFSNKNENLESTMIHELIHLKLADLDEVIEKTLYELFPKGKKEKGFNIVYNEFLKSLENAVDDLEKGFSELAGIKTTSKEVKGLIERKGRRKFN